MFLFFIDFLILIGGCYTINYLWERIVNKNRSNYLLEYIPREDINEDIPPPYTHTHTLMFIENNNTGTNDIRTISPINREEVEDAQLIEDPPTYEEIN